MKRLLASSMTTLVAVGTFAGSAAAISTSRVPFALSAKTPILAPGQRWQSKMIQEADGTLSWFASTGDPQKGTGEYIQKAQIYRRAANGTWRRYKRTDGAAQGLPIIKNVPWGLYRIAFFNDTGRTTRLKVVLKGHDDFRDVYRAKIAKNRPFVSAHIQTDGAVQINVYSDDYAATHPLSSTCKLTVQARETSDGKHFRNVGPKLEMLHQPNYEAVIDTGIRGYYEKHVKYQFAGVSTCDVKGITLGFSSLVAHPYN
jgi:hypothetical protein